MVKIDATPWARDLLTPNDYARIEATCLVTDVSSVTLSADQRNGPWRCRLDGDEHTTSSWAGPVAAFDLAIDRRNGSLR